MYFPSYITRESASPQGKPRVWFCCHPADQEIYLKSMARELLSMVNCALWYDSNPTVPTLPQEQAEKEESLSSMNLFLIPVTTRLLTQRSYDFDRQFQIAQQKHIPILPILKESGLENAFNKKFGNLQYLDPNMIDPTALPYAEKLKQYLDSVLVGDELAAKVRASFNAYIFLSYRKKDRHQAQALMKIIHQYEFCQDIAIWYDEFLTPGENFNAEILTALEKSALFIMVVTPTLLQSPNYVMMKEFPRAKNVGKTILAVEMKPTDWKNLNKVYPGIPPCATPNFPELGYQLRTALGKVIKQRKSREPAHNYFVGLAYLSGIDVEIDKERALNLIREAALSGYPEAVGKLAVMYRTGEGVVQDYKSAIQWQEKLVDFRKKEWEHASTDSSFIRYANALWCLADDYKSIEDFANAIDIWNKKFISLCQKAEIENISYAKRYLSIAYGMLGDLFNLQGKLGNVQSLLLKTIDLRLQLLRKEVNYQTARDFFLSIDAIGIFYLERGKLIEARSWFEKSTSLIALKNNEGKPLISRKDTALLYTRLGTLCQKEKNYSSAMHWFMENMRLRTELANEIDTIEERKDLAKSFKYLGSLCQEQKKFISALNYFEKSMSILNSIFNENGTQEVRQSLAENCNKLGNLYLEERKLNEAQHWFEESIKTLKEIPKETRSPKTILCLSTSYEKLGDIYQANNNLAGARDWFEKSFYLRQKLAEKVDTPQIRDMLALALYRLGSLSEGQMEKLCQAASIWKQLSEEFPSVVDYAEKSDMASKKAINYFHFEDFWK